jgi:hypothetical protein
MPEGFNITDKITAMVESVQQELSAHPSLEELCEKIRLIPEKMQEPMRLAIIGKSSSSKSTLVNAILGNAEVLLTDGSETTWNVSWLKYGKIDDRITIHFKDKNKPDEKIERHIWKELANRQSEGNEQLKNEVLYFEVPYPCEILKQINIIDTPGLSSSYGQDSQNTKDFMNLEKPDAIIMLFTKSIDETILNEVNSFRQDLGVGVSPINAIGIIGKIDDFWEGTDHALEPLAIAQKSIAYLMSNEEVKKTLFNVYPVSALTALAACRITEDDLTTLKDMSELPDEVLFRIFKSEKRFVADYENVSVSANKRSGLRSVYGRYGVWLLINQLKETPNSSNTNLQELLLKKSGFRDFSDILQKHFVEQSSLIKAYKLIGELSKEFREYFKKFDDNSAEKWSLINIIRQVDDLICTLTIQSNVIDVLTEIYEGKLNVEEKEVEELRRLNGDFGISCIERTGLNENAATQEMLNVCLERIKYWRGLLNTKGRFKVSLTPFMKQMINSYSLLLRDINSAKCKLESANKFLFGK